MRLLNIICVFMLILVFLALFGCSSPVSKKSLWSVAPSSYSYIACVDPVASSSDSELLSLSSKFVGGVPFSDLVNSASSSPKGSVLCVFFVSPSVGHVAILDSGSNNNLQLPSDSPFKKLSDNLAISGSEDASELVTKTFSSESISLVNEAIPSSSIGSGVSILKKEGNINVFLPQKNLIKQYAPEKSILTVSKSSNGDVVIQTKLFFSGEPQAIDFASSFNESQTMMNESAVTSDTSNAFKVLKDATIKNSGNSVIITYQSSYDVMKKLFDSKQTKSQD